MHLLAQLEMGVCTMQVWAVRDNVSELVLGVSAAHLAVAPYYSLTFALVAFAYGLSIVIPSGEAPRKAGEGRTPRNLHGAPVEGDST
jgi:hypothetical protein